MVGPTETPELPTLAGFDYSLVANQRGVETSWRRKNLARRVIDFRGDARLWNRGATNKKMRQTLLSIAALAAASCCWASQPKPISLTLSTELFALTNSRLMVTNNTGRAQTVQFSAGSLSTLEFSPRRAVLPPGRQQTVDLGPLRFIEGVNVLHIVTNVVSPSGRGGHGPALLEPVRMTRGSLAKISYEEAFLNNRIRMEGAPEPGEFPLGAGYVDRDGAAALVYPAGSLNAELAPGPLAVSSPEELTRMEARALSDVGAPTVGTLYGRAAVDEAVAEATPTTGGGGSDDNPPVVLTGRLYAKLPSGAWEPAWGWTARVYQLKSGVWKYRNAAQVNGSGAWVMTLTGVDASESVQIQFQPSNRFVRVQDPSGATYTWSKMWSLANGGATGNHAVDLSQTGNLPGVHAIFRSAMDLWQRFVSAGINPVHDNPIRISYPNSYATGKCRIKDEETGVTFGWTCTMGLGDIWILPQHADSFVVQHEMAHSVNLLFWGSFPDDAGGAHSSTGCYTVGLALTEGFADFIPAWIKYNRQSTSAYLGYLDTDLESVGDEPCQGTGNELRVAASFWDMYDVKSDSRNANAIDTWYLSNEAGVVSLYLKYKQSSLWTYAYVLRMIAPAWSDDIDKLLRLNYQIN